MIHLSNIVYINSTKDNLIGSVLYFNKNVAFEIWLQLLHIPKQIYKTLFYFDIVCLVNTKHLDDTFV